MDELVVDESTTKDETEDELEVDELGKPEEERVTAHDALGVRIAVGLLPDRRI